MVSCVDAKALLEIVRALIITNKYLNDILKKFKEIDVNEMP